MPPRNILFFGLANTYNSFSQNTSIVSGNSYPSNQLCNEVVLRYGGSSSVALPRTIAIPSGLFHSDSNFLVSYYWCDDSSSVPPYLPVVDERMESLCENCSIYFWLLRVVTVTHCNKSKAKKRAKKEC